VNYNKAQTQITMKIGIHIYNIFKIPIDGSQKRISHFLLKSDAEAATNGKKVKQGKVKCKPAFPSPEVTPIGIPDCAR
jgi:hypothetical protein